MRLTRLEIYGFKSFTSKTEIVFPKNITGIVGPNGSGKSNIADAVRWVLGEQNPRILRGGKMEDVIFNGTQKRKAMNFCEVSLIFDNEDRLLHPDYLELMITRRVYRNGDSEYEINKSPCRLKDIVEMFSDTGIGKEGYSIIGQGRIDEILSRKTEDRRAVFEEAAGISYYRLRKHEAEQRLSRTQDNLIRINDIANEQENLLGPLKLQAENARKYLQLNDSLKRLSSAIFLLDYDRLVARKENITNNIDDTETQLACFEIDLNKYSEDIDIAQNNLVDLEEICSKAAEEAILADRELGSIREKNSGLLSKFEAQNQNLERMNSEALRLQESINKILAAMDKDCSGKEDAMLALEKAQTLLNEKEIEFSKEQEKSDNIKKENEALKTQLIDNMNKLSQTESGRSRQIAIKEQMQIRLAELDASHIKMQAANKGIFQGLNDKKNELDLQNDNLSNIKKDKSLLEDKFENIVLSIREKDSLIRQYSQDLSSKIAKHKTMQDMSKDYEGYANAVKFAMNSAKNMNGVYGSLANVIKVEEKYEVAMDMVLGGALQNIITESEYEAKELIDLLRTKQMGRATFLPISSVLSMDLSNVERNYLSFRGCLGRASDLVSFSEKFRGIVENLLGRTLLIEELEDGINLRKAGCKLRMVTLRGDVMHSGGSMTGGSVKSNTGGFLARERMLAELEQEIVNLQDKLEKESQEFEKLQALRQDLDLERKNIEQLEHEQEIKIIRLKDILKAAEDDILTYVEQDKEIEEAIEQLKQSIIEIETDLLKLDELSGTAKLDSSSLKQKIEELTEEINKQNNICDVLQNELTSIKLQYSDADHIHKQYLRDEKRTQENLLEAESQLNNIKNQILLVEKDIDGISQSLFANKEDQEKAREKFESLENHQKEQEHLRISTSKKIRMLQEEEDNLRQAQMKAVEKQHRLELQLQNVQSEQRSLSDMLWNRFELTYANAEIYRPDSSFNIKEAELQQQEISQSIRALGTVNVNAVEEYNDLKARHDELILQRDDLLKSIDDLNALIKKLLLSMEKQFVESFDQLKIYFSETFSRLFDGGQGEICLSNPELPLESGIDIVVQPPGKKKQILSLFSGGERTLTAIALIFAMLKLRPSPFCVFDEIEAALDDANISNFADYLKDFSEKTQFIVVTHRKGTMERCDSLYGVAMAEQGVSTMLSIDLSTYKE